MSGIRRLPLALCALVFFVSARALACPMCAAAQELTISAQELVYAEHSVLAIPVAGSNEFGVVEGSGTSISPSTGTVDLGIEHIWGGIDHLLFVLALLLLVPGWRRVVATITAFTVAHSLTLAAATLGFVHVPQKPVEATIALSRIRGGGNRPRTAGQTGIDGALAVVIAFAFGLLHGFGFASALNQVGLPQNAIPVALLFFNLGVEAGQLLFIAAVLVVVGFARKALDIRHSRFNTRFPWVWRLPPYTIGSVAAFWLIQRIVAFGA
jgi:hypothetical protein